LGRKISTYSTARVVIVKGGRVQHFAERHAVCLGARTPSRPMCRRVELAVPRLLCGSNCRLTAFSRVVMPIEDAVLLLREAEVSKPPRRCELAPGVDGSRIILPRSCIASDPFEAQNFASLRDLQT